MIESVYVRETPEKSAHVWSYLCVGDKVVKEAVDPIDFFQNDQTLPSLTLVVRLFLVVTIKEQSKIDGARG